MSTATPILTSFDGDRRIGSGSPQVVALATKRALESGALGPILIFDDATGRSIDINTRGSDEEVLARLAQPETDDTPSEAIPEPADTPRRPGRPKLGVVPREVTLLPRHWEWLATQKGGASVALRKLVEAARHASGESDRLRKAHERAYHFISAMAGDRAGFEEATRALFANDRPRFTELTDAWPHDVRDHALKLAFDDLNRERHS